MFPFRFSGVCVGGLRPPTQKKHCVGGAYEIRLTRTQDGLELGGGEWELIYCCLRVLPKWER